MLHRRVAYDLAIFDLPKTVAELLGVSDLATLQPPPGLALLSREKDQTPAPYKQFYSQFDRMRELYDAFVSKVAAPVLAEPYCYQTIPTLRIHYPLNVAVGEFHRDSDYNHPDGEVNFWVPLTAAWGSNTLWLEEAPDQASPVEARPGDVIVFDAVSIRHGNKVNKTDATRVSFDFRCLPLSKYHPSDQRSVNSGLRFRIGEYYRAPA